MRIILLGAPGAGKGTQAELIAESLKIPASSTGNMLRESIKNHTEIGERVKADMDHGNLVSDELIIQILAQRVAREDCKPGYILDGVPRTIPQAQALDAAGIEFDFVVSIEIEDGVIERRMSGRRVCPGCGASYHMQTHLPKREGICDHCGEKLVIRPDDELETVRNRLQVFHHETEVLKHYYEAHGKLKLVDGNQSIEDTHRAIMAAIGVTL